jgi:hypothetical protein
VEARRGIVIIAGALAAVLLAAMAVRPAHAIARPVAGAPDCAIFPASSPWNQRVDRLPVAAGSAALMRATGIDHLHADFSDSDADGYGIPINVVASTTRRAAVSFDYADESDPGPYPIPNNPLIEGGGDRHLLMLERDACVLHELFGAEETASGWHAGSGARWTLSSLALRPEGWTSADAAGLPILPGLARHEELAAGGIDHALRITLPDTQRAYLWPARHYASSDTRAATAPMGLRLRVKASFDTTGFGPQTRAILEAGKQYGFIVADNGSAGYISGAPARGWDDDDLHALHQVPGSALEVVDVTTLPGTPVRRRLWNPRWTALSTRTMRLNAFNARAGYVTGLAVRNGRVVATRRVFARQGLLSLAMRRVAGARYAFRLR